MEHEKISDLLNEPSDSRIVTKKWNIVKDITIIGQFVTQVAFKNCALFTTFITKINGATVDDGEDLDLVMPTYNLLENS